MVANHIHELELPAPGGRAELDAALAEIHSRPLRLDRPLWEMTFITGLEGGRIAVAVKIHHAVADGVVAAAAALVAVAAAGPDETVAGPDEVWKPEPLPPRAALIREAIADRVRELRMFRGCWRARSPAVDGCCGPGGSSTTGLPRRCPGRRHHGTAGSPPAVPSRRPGSPSRISSASRRRSAARSTMSCWPSRPAGCAAPRPGKGSQLDKPLVTAIPSAIDAPDAPPRLSGNHVTQFFTSLCTDIDDPVERLAAISKVTRNARSLNAAIGRELMHDWNLYAYRWPYQLMWKHVMPRLPRPAINVVISNVPGPSETELVRRREDGRAVLALGPHRGGRAQPDRLELCRLPVRGPRQLPGAGERHPRHG